MILRCSVCLLVAFSVLAFFSPLAETEETQDSASPKTAPAKEQRKETFTRKEHYEALSEYLKRARDNDQKRQEKELPLTLVVLKPGESRTVTTVLNGPIGGRQQLQYFSESFAYPDEKTTKPNAGDFGEFVEFHRNGFKMEKDKSDSGDVSQQLKRSSSRRAADFASPRCRTNSPRTKTRSRGLIQSTLTGSPARDGRRDGGSRSAWSSCLARSSRELRAVRHRS